ncbi:hypothetical protein [Sphingomonas sp. OK281]|uniref:hypothetical protein n=1 Tax=Sphingomonas sp. OK281 TaxID=1881067 RepID=UPI0008E9452E|nr:hypothetical protein [Sphingomonas sp. OK281]SFN86590.1 hypothetical protein SAMN05428984_1199 [Sphingomonas sp. OK281]
MMVPIRLALTGARLVSVATIPNAHSRDDRAASEPGIRVTVSGLRDQRERLKLELDPAEATDFLAKDEALLRAGKVFRRIVTAVPSLARDGTLCVNVPRPGRDAVLGIHERSGNPSISIDDDRVSLPGSEHLGRRHAPFAQAVVTAGDQLTAVAAPMQYRRGLGGFKQMLQ